MRRPHAALLLLGALLAGCALPGERTAAPPPVPAGARPGGVLTVGITSPSGVAPGDAYDPPGRLVARTLCDTLVSLDPLTGRPVPGLLRAWQVSGDTVTLQLRHGVHFTDGTELGARDVGFSLNRLANPVYASREARLLSPLVGYEELARNLFADAHAQLFSGIQVVDQYDLQLRLTAKDPGFVRVLAEPATAPISATAALAHPQAVTSDPVCVGPYRLDHPYRPGDREILLDRSARYYARNVGYTGGGRGYADRIAFEIFPGPAAAYAAGRQGRLDLVAVPPAAAAQAVPAGFSTVTGSEPSVELLGLPDGLDNPLSGAAVHRALSEAIDRQALDAVVWHGRQAPAHGFLPPGLGADAAGTGCGPLAPATGDVAGARAQLSPAQLAALAAATVPLYVNDDYANRLEAAELARQWQAAFGLHVTVTALPWNQYLQRATVGAGFDGPFRVSWAAGATAPEPTDTDPAHFLGGLFRSTSTQAGNWAHLSDPRFDLGYSEDLLPADGLSRRQWLQRTTTRLCEEMPVIPLVSGQTRWLLRSSALGSARPSYLSVDGAPLLRELYRR